MGKARAGVQLAAAGGGGESERGWGEPNASFSHFPLSPEASRGHSDSIFTEQFSGRLVGDRAELNLCTAKCI